MPVWAGDWRIISERVDEFKELIRERRYNSRTLSLTVGKASTYFQGKFSKQDSTFGHDVFSRMAKALDLQKAEIERFFRPLTGTARRYLKAMDGGPPQETPKPAAEVKRISTGYQCTFTGSDGKIHTAYGATELEARQAMERRKAVLAPQEVPKEKRDRLSVTISGDEAMVLLNQLMNDFRHGTVNEDDKQVIQSIFLRLSTQII
jgi:hypothetical protein